MDMGILYGIMVCKLDQQIVVREFDSHWVVI